MKKLLVIGLLALGAVTFAANGQGAGQGNRQAGGVTRMAANNNTCVVTGTSQRANQGNFMGGKMGRNNGRRGGYVALTPEQQKLRTQNSIAIQEKRLEVRKEMIKDNINWNNVGKLNKDIANLRADQQTQMMKYRAENAAKAAAPAAN